MADNHHSSSHPLPSNRLCNPQQSRLYYRGRNHSQSYPLIIVLLLDYNVPHIPILNIKAPVFQHRTVEAFWRCNLDRPHGFEQSRGISVPE